jgi:hypothetical protein
MSRKQKLATFRQLLTLRLLTAALFFQLPTARTRIDSPEKDHRGDRFAWRKPLCHGRKMKRPFSESNQVQSDPH